jgi:enoyl-CoA hydratase/carnithine racemase
LNRPPSKNALSPELVEALRGVVPKVVADDSVRAVILAGAGGAFCSGADLKTGLSQGGAAPVSGLLEALHSVIRAITTARQPFIAAVGGAAVGFGCDLALACDLRVVSTQGYFQEIFVKIGLMPDGGGTFVLPRLVGMGRALEYMMLGRRIEADLAREVGIANRVVGPGDLAAEARTLAEELAAAPPLALARIKKAVRENSFGTLDRALDHEKASQLELLASQDLVEGVMAWAQKRPPVFQGK